MTKDWSDGRLSDSNGLQRTSNGLYKSDRTSEVRLDSDQTPSDFWCSPDVRYDP